MPAQMDFCVRSVPEPVIIDSAVFENYRFELLSNDQAYETMEIDPHTLLEIWHTGCEYYTSVYTVCFNGFSPNMTDSLLYSKAIRVLLKVAPYDSFGDWLEEGSGVLETHLNKNDLAEKDFDFEAPMEDFRYRVAMDRPERFGDAACVSIRFIIGPL